MTSMKDKKSIHHRVYNPQSILSEGKVVFRKINLKNEKKKKIIIKSLASESLALENMVPSTLH